MTLPEAFTTGSSIMPQKRNPDVFELVRGRCAVAQAGARRGARASPQKLPSGYHRDLQLIKAPLFRGIDSRCRALDIVAAALPGVARSARAHPARPGRARGRGGQRARRRRGHTVSRGVSAHRREIRHHAAQGAIGVTEAPIPGAATPGAGLVRYANWVYALHALAILIGLTSGTTIAGRFLFSLPSIVAVIMNYARRHEAAGTYLASHFRWQIRTFWFALLWLVVTSIIAAPLILALGLGFVVWWIGLSLVGLWIAYRIVRGWLSLRDAEPVGEA